MKLKSLFYACLLGIFIPFNAISAEVDGQSGFNKAWEDKEDSQIILTRDVDLFLEDSLSGTVSKSIGSDDTAAVTFTLTLEQESAGLTTTGKLSLNNLTLSNLSNAKTMFHVNENDAEFTDVTLNHACAGILITEGTMTLKGFMNLNIDTVTATSALFIANDFTIDEQFKLNLIDDMSPSQQIILFEGATEETLALIHYDDTRYSLTLQGNQIILTVPEPTTTVFLTLAAISATLRRRRH